eukprot:CAMPEP_0181027756 /NCGR_PEP_ID=MMETSP1070-20121207/4324_1 /TAXON_ID=265543 /ORGANISM="Minutocellus polymorphus, Strain NH13" /LENGTH=1000 /DNA_ID=CAMNT_0023104999 /DNA_START=50 /DNA_END=3052 /DNA_ORIENTATION=-
MASSLVAALLLSSSLIGPASVGRVDAFSISAPSGTGASSSVLVGSRGVVPAPSRSVTALRASDRPSGPSADSLVSVHSGDGSGRKTDGGGGGGGDGASGGKRRRTGSGNKSKRRATTGGGGTASPQSKNRRNNNNSSSQSNRNRRRSDNRSTRPSAAPPSRATQWSKERHLALRSKLEKMQHRSVQGEELAQSYCDELLGLCVATDEWDSVLEVLTVMKDQGLSQTRSSYRACLEQCSKVNNGASALEILKAMQQAGVEPNGDDVTMAVKTMCRGGRWRNAKALLLRSAEQLPDAPAASAGNDGKIEGAKSKDDDGVVADDDSSASEDGDASKIISVDAYNAVMSSMKEEKKWKEAVQFLSLMEKGHGSSNKGGSGGSTKTKTVDDADRVHPRPTLVTYHHALEACASSGESEQAVTLLMSMRDKGTEPTSHTFDLVVRGLLKRSQWRRALKLLELMEEWEVPQSTRIYNIIISACAKAREVGQAMALLKKMRTLNIKPDVVTFNALISACASAGRWKDSMSLLQQCQREPGVDPDIITYTNAIRACARARKFKDAIELLQVLQDLGLTPDVYAYTAAIDACAKGKMWRKALDILDEMRTRGVQPTEVTYSVAITACGNGGQWQRAMELLNQMRMKGMSINVITYSSTISALAKAARRNMKETGGGEGSSEELSSKALDLLEQMKKEGVEPDTYSYSGAISACASAGRWEEALDLMAQMKKGGPKTRPNRITYTGAISACGRAGEWEHALRLFDEMRNDGLQADRISYNAVFSALRVGMQPERAYEIWGEMLGRRKEGQPRDSTKDEGGSSKAAPTSKPYATATSDPKLSPDIITLTDVIATLDRSEGDTNRERMDEVFDEAVELGIILPTDSLDSLWEVDLSGMSIPVAHAACRHIVQRARRAVASGESPCEDLMLITGVGAAHKAQGQDDDGADIVGASQQAPGRRGRGNTALREYVRQVLRDDFNPPLYSTIPHLGQGTVHVSADAFQKWLDGERQQ